MLSSESCVWKWKAEPPKALTIGAPVGAVGMDAPDAPVQIVAKALVFQRAEHDAPVLEDHRVQGAGDVQVADHFQNAFFRDSGLSSETSGPGRCSINSPATMWKILRAVRPTRFFQMTSTTAINAGPYATPQQYYKQP